MSRRNGPSNLELAMMLGNLNPNSTTRPCTQCSKEVPKTQVLLTCDTCREKKKRQKDRRKERDMAVEEGRGAGAGFDSAPLQAVVARQEQETAARRAARRKDGGAKADAAGASGSTSGSLGMGMGIVMQAILDEHQRESAPKPKPASKKKTTKKAREEEEGLDFLTSLLLFEMATKAGSTSRPAKGASGSGTKRKFKETESEANEPGTVYDAETAKKRMRGDMPMPKLEPIPQAGQESRKAVAEPVASTSKLPPVKKAKKSIPEPTAASASASGPLPLERKSSNLPPSSIKETEPTAKPLKIQASLTGWFKPTPKATA